MDQTIDEQQQAIESFFKRGWGFVRYDENGLHFLEADFELLEEIE